MTSAPHIRLVHGDSREVLPTLHADSVDSIVTDPPYELNLAKRRWDRTGIAHDPDFWREALRVLKPGGHLLAFGGTRTYHRLASAIEDAGFQILDCVFWIYGEGFPKSTDIAKAIDRQAGAKRRVVATRKGNVIVGKMLYNRQRRADTVLEITEPTTEEAKRWGGWGTSLKPACEPIVLARKPFEGKLLDHVRTRGLGALNIDGCRIAYADGETPYVPAGSAAKGRFPSNVMFDEDAAQLLGKRSRFFYVAKSSKAERGEYNHHLTVKPLALIRELVRLVTPPGGTVLDPFGGSGTLALAAEREGFGAIVVERDDESFETAQRRFADARVAEWVAA